MFGGVARDGQTERETWNDEYGAKKETQWTAWEEQADKLSKAGSLARGRNRGVTGISVLGTSISHYRSLYEFSGFFSALFSSFFTAAVVISVYNVLEVKG